MTKVKIFRFEVSNAASRSCDNDKNQSWYRNKLEKLDNEEYIEEYINDFIKGVNVISININTIDVGYHNNGRGNTIHLIYTIVYNE